MSAPSSDRAAIRQVIRALKAAGYVVTHVHDGDVHKFYHAKVGDLTLNPSAPLATEAMILEDLTACDESTLYVDHPERRDSFVYFVLGNEPFEVACDYGVSLDDVLTPLFDSWED